MVILPIDANEARSPSGNRRGSVAGCAYAAKKFVVRTSDGSPSGMYIIVPGAMSSVGDKLLAAAIGVVLSGMPVYMSAMSANDWPSRTLCVFIASIDIDSGLLDIDRIDSHSIGREFGVNATSQLAVVVVLDVSSDAHSVCGVFLPFARGRVQEQRCLLTVGPADSQVSVGEV